MAGRSNPFIKFITSGITQLAATLGALTLIGGSLWAAGDYTGVRPVLKSEFVKVQQAVDQNQLVLLQLRFQLLMQKKQYGGLEFSEQQELCSIARTLQYVGVPGC
jgi:hypothetical protein